MKKSIISLLIFSVSLFNSYSQDSIFFKNENDVKAKILEINKKDIKYKLYDNQDGPTYTINKKDIYLVKYNNGYSESFTRKKYRRGDQKQIIDTTFHRFMLGGGMIIGVYNPSDVFDYIDRFAKYYDLHIDEIDNSIKNMNIGLSALVGFKFTREFNMNVVGEYNSNSLKVYNSNHDGNTFSLTKKTIGIMGNEVIPLNRKLGINITEGITYNNISFSAIHENLLSGDNIGFRLQAGINFYFSRLFTLQGLVGGDYAKVTKNNFNMDFSGLLFTVNIIFNK